MKLRVTCTQCLRELFELEEQVPQNGPTFPATATISQNNDGCHVVTCSKGHVTLLAFGAAEFEIILWMAADILMKEETDAAVLRFFHALEKFEEFLCEFYLSRLGYYGHESRQVLDTTRKFEQQRKGFLFGLNEMDSLRNPHGPRPMSKSARQAISELRNKVAHQGYIPNPEECRVYSTKVYSYICEMTSSCVEHGKDIVTFIIGERIGHVSKDKRHDLQMSVVGHGIDGPVNFAHDKRQVSLDEYMDRIRDYEQLMDRLNASGT